MVERILFMSIVSSTSIFVTLQHFREEKVGQDSLRLKRVPTLTLPMGLPYNIIKHSYKYKRNRTRNMLIKYRYKS